MAYLYFDMERGSSVLGNEQDIKEHFGFEVLRPATWEAFQETIAAIYQRKKIKVQKNIGGILINEEQYEVTPREGVKLDGTIIDTYSELSKKYQRSLVNKDGKMKIDQWGKLKNKLDLSLKYIQMIPGIVILNVHARLKDTDEGTKVLPYIDGSTKEDISKWFDFVLYTKCIIEGGERKFVWITKRSEMYSHGKDRTDLLPEIIPQDYTLIKDAIKGKGWPGARVLVIGEPGSGKTKSLLTL